MQTVLKFNIESNFLSLSQSGGIFQYGTYNMKQSYFLRHSVQFHNLKNTPIEPTPINVK